MESDESELKLPLEAPPDADISPRTSIYPVLGLVLCFSFRLIECNLSSSLICSVSLLLLLSPSRGSQTTALAVAVLNVVPLALQLIFLAQSVKSGVSVAAVNYFGLQVSTYSVVSGSVPLAILGVGRLLPGEVSGVAFFRMLRVHSAPITVSLFIAVSSIRTNVWGIVYMCFAVVTLIYNVVKSGRTGNLFSVSVINLVRTLLSLAIMAELLLRLWLPSWLVQFTRPYADQPALQAFLGLSESSPWTSAEVYGDFLLLITLSAMSQEAGLEAEARRFDWTIRAICYAAWLGVLAVWLSLKPSTEISADAFIILASTIAILQRSHRFVFFSLMIFFIIWTSLNVLVKSRCPTMDLLLSTPALADIVGMGNAYITTAVGLFASISVVLFFSEDPQHTVRDRIRNGRYFYELRCRLLFSRRRQDAVRAANTRKLNRVSAKWTDFDSGAVSPFSPQLFANRSSDDSVAIEDLCARGHPVGEAQQALQLAEGDVAKALSILEMLREYGAGHMSADEVCEKVGALVHASPPTLVTPMESDEEEIADDEEQKRSLVRTLPAKRSAVKEMLNAVYVDVDGWLSRHIQDEIFVQSAHENLFDHRREDRIFAKFAKFCLSAGEWWLVAVAVVSFLLNRCALRIPVLLVASWAFFNAFPTPKKHHNTVVFVYSVVLLFSRLAVQMALHSDAIQFPAWMVSPETGSRGLEKTLGVGEHPCDLLQLLFADVLMVCAILSRRTVLHHMGLFQPQLEEKQPAVEPEQMQLVLEEHSDESSQDQDRGQDQDKDQDPFSSFEDAAETPAAAASLPGLGNLLREYRQLRHAAQTDMSDLEKEKPPGRDLHVIVFVLSLLLWVFVLFGYRFMTQARRNWTQKHGREYNVLDDIKSGELPGKMTLLLCFHAVLMVTDRLYYVATGQVGREKKNVVIAKVRLILRFSIFFVVQAFVLLEDFCTWAMMVYYCLFSLYYGLLLLQTRDGIPVSALDSLRPTIRSIDVKEYFQVALFYAYQATPFLHELRTFFDWSVRKTCLDSRDYFTVQDCHNVLFVAQYRRAQKKKYWPGQTVPFFWNKLLSGWLVSLLLLIVLFGPLLIFSSAVKKDMDAPLVDMHMAINLLVEVCQAAPKNSCDDLSVQIWSGAKAKIGRELGTNEKKQMIAFERLSYSEFKTARFAAVAREVRAAVGNRDAQVTMGLQLVYEYSRELNVDGSIEHKNDYAETFVCAVDKKQTRLDPIRSRSCTGFEWASIWTLFDYMSDPVSKAPVTVTEVMPAAWTFLRSGTERPEGKHRNDLKFELLQTDGSVFEVTPVVNKSDQRDISTTFYVQPMQSNSIFVQIGLVGMYASIVYAIGRILKASYSGQTYSAIYDALDAPEELIEVVHAIAIAQQRCDIKREYLLYQALCRLLRSPETLLTLDQPLETYGVGQVIKPPYPELLPARVRANIGLGSNTN